MQCVDNKNPPYPPYAPGMCTYLCRKKILLHLQAKFIISPINIQGKMNNPTNTKTARHVHMCVLERDLITSPNKVIQRKFNISENTYREKGTTPKTRKQPGMCTYLCRKENLIASPRGIHLNLLQALKVASMSSKMCTLSQVYWQQRKC